MQTGKIFIISGPSGVGKSTILKELLAEREDLYFSVSATTRAPREGETDGVQYHFLDKALFQSWIAEDAFFEYAEYAGNYYGSPQKFVDLALQKGQDVIMDIEVQGAMQVKAKRPECVRIFLAPPSWEELERRLQSRGTDTQEVIAKRLLRAKEEFLAAEDYDYLVINDTVSHAVQEIEAILVAEHCKASARKSAFQI